MNDFTASRKIAALTAIIQTLIIEHYWGVGEETGKQRFFDAVAEDDPVSMAIANELNGPEIDVAFAWPGHTQTDVEEEVPAPTEQGRGGTWLQEPSSASRQPDRAERTERQERTPSRSGRSFAGSNEAGARGSPAPRAYSQRQRQTGTLPRTREGHRTTISP